MKLLIKLFFVIAIILVFWFFSILFSDNGVEQENSFVVRSGESLNDISENLHEEGLIKNEFVFRTWFWLKKAEDKVRAGTYLFPSDISIRQVSNILMQMPSDNQKTFTIIGGWNRNWGKLKEEFAENNLSYQEFLNLTASKKDWEDDYDFLRDAPATASLEGYLFPDTYFIDQNTTVEGLIVKTLNNFDRKLTDELREEIERQGKTIFEIVTLASIVEREVSSDEDRKMVADIFLKRLDIDLGLQSDATVNFVTGKGLAQPTLADLEIDSPYNTYKYAGLPPGPIANPTLSSIEAVIYPTKNPYYYFLNTKDGQTIYSKTYEEHLQNKAKYLN